MVKSAPDVPWKAGELRVLLVDDEPDVLLGLEMLAKSLAADVDTASSAEEALDCVSRRKPHVVLSDITMPGRSGLDLLAELKRRDDAIVVILLTGFGTIDMAVSALQAGAVHFITKPFDNQEILSSLCRYGQEALVNARVREMVQEAEDPASVGAEGRDVLIAEDPKMRELLGLIREVAASPMSVLIEGESGTGKERIARALHRMSDHRDLPFIGINAAALPDTLLESELFGHRKGAFTGADVDRKGIFESAQGGTVFLDEIALMSRAFQEKLLRVLQEKTVTPLGTSTPVDVDFRLVAATNRDLKRRIAENEFHADLYFRLTVVTLRVPPLRDRRADIAPLAAHFLGLHSSKLRGRDQSAPPRLGEDALLELEAYDWPGNVRELENTMQRALVLSHGETIRAHNLGLEAAQDEWASPLEEDLPYDEGKKRAVERFQRQYVREALRRARGNVTHAAQGCGLTRAALQRIMRSLNVERVAFLDDDPA